MKIVKIIGGLGNQMFQYAFYKRLLKENQSEEVLVDILHFDTYGIHNGFELESVFPIVVPKASKEDLLKVTRYIQDYKLSRIIRKLLPIKSTEYIEKKDFIYDENCLHIKNDVFYEGYWQNSKYFDAFDEELRKDFTFSQKLSSSNSSILDDIESSNSISIHIRRGDYLNNKLYKGICDLEYYQKAIKNITESVKNPKFFIFSNDIIWCEGNLSNLFSRNSYLYVNGNSGSNSYIDMQLMSHCKHNIIANSSFSWWAAWLNNYTNKIVIAPKTWLNRSGTGKIQPESWILL